MGTLLPTTFSATALQVAELCLARYNAEFIQRGRNFQGSAANVGIVLHGTLEEYIRQVFMIKSAPWNEKLFWEIFHAQYVLIFGPDRTLPEYEDAREIARNWFHRPDIEEELSSVKIISLEAKNNFQVKGANGIPVNYIMDRLDQIAPTIFKVVDYKTNRVSLTPEQLRKKIQAKLYALAVQILYPDATEIWVEFDFLRHRPVSTLFTRDDNVNTYRMLQRAVRRILETSDTKIPETLNSECGWCVRKASCTTLQNHIKVGGILGKDLEELAELWQNITAQRSAQDRLVDEILDRLLKHAIQLDTLEYELDNATVRVTAPVRRKPDHALIGIILGPKLAAELGSFRVGAIDDLIKKGRVTAAQAQMLKDAMPKEVGDPTVKIEMRDAR